MNDMQFRQAGNSELNLSVLGLGTWALGGGDWRFGWGDQDDADSIAAVHKALELGINWIDTAAIYGEGRSEEVIGNALSQLAPDQRPLIATKCSRIPRGDGNIDGCLRRDSVKSECEASLKRLKIDCIDLYQIHWPMPDEDIEEGWQALVELQEQGKVRHIGVSNHSVTQMERLEMIAPIATLQPPYSMFAREIEDGILPYCGEHHIGIICYSPMAKGLLTGSFTAERAAALSDNDHRSRDPKFQSPQLEINLNAVERLKGMADDLGWTLPDLAIAWVLRHPEVTSAIVGIRRPEQLEQTITAGDRNMTDDVVTAITSVLEDRDAELAQLGDISKSRV